MAETKYIEVLQDGFTVNGRVHRAGEVASMPADRVKGKREQVARRKRPIYKEISESEFREKGGQVEATRGLVGTDGSSQRLGGDPHDPKAAAKVAQKAEEERRQAEVQTGGGTGTDEFSHLEGKNRDETLEEVSQYDDAKTQRFIEWEKSHENRSTVLGPLGAG